MILNNFTQGFSRILTLAEVVNTLVGKRVVVVLPRELGLDVTAGGQGLHSLNDLQVRDINVLVLGEVVVLGGNQNTVYITKMELKHWHSQKKSPGLIAPLSYP
jgi:hypothetical protein